MFTVYCCINVLRVVLNLCPYSMLECMVLQSLYAAVLYNLYLYTGLTQLSLQFVAKIIRFSILVPTYGGSEFLIKKKFFFYNNKSKCHLSFLFDFESK